MMNIETLLQAAQILEDQQLIPSKKPLTKDECSIPENSIPTTILSSTAINTNPIILPTTSLIKGEQYPQDDLNIHLHQFIQQQARSTQQHFKSTQNDNDHEDDDEDDIDQNTEKNSESSTRTQTTCFRDREIHNRLEKYRRAHLKDCFDTLKIEVPCQRDRKITNLQVLNLAIKYIQSLKRKERKYENEVALLTSRNLELQQRLSTLKTELNSEGHNVDTWLNSCPDIDHSVSTRTASEAEMYRTLDDDDDDNDDNNIDDQNSSSNKSIHLEQTIDSKILFNNRKSTSRQKSRTSTKKTLASIPTTNLLQTLTSSDNFLDYNLTRHLQLNQTCNLLATVKDTPINDIRYDIVDMFTKGTNSQIQQTSPLPSIASLMNRHTSPIVSPVKQTIGINTDVLTTSTTNILHQPVPTS